MENVVARFVLPFGRRANVPFDFERILPISSRLDFRFRRFAPASQTHTCPRSGTQPARLDEYNWMHGVDGRKRKPRPILRPSERFALESKSGLTR